VVISPGSGVVSCRQRHAQGVADQVAAVLGLGQDEARLAAQDPESVGERRAVTGTHLGAQRLQFVREHRGLRPVEQPERYLRLVGHDSIFLSRYGILGKLAGQPPTAG
jgi:hypothetical protein